MPTKTTLPDYISTFSPARQILAGKLFAHKWFMTTSPDIQREILDLPEDYQGFLEDLASRPDEIGELDVLKMTKLGYGNYLILPVFEVRSNITNQIFTYEYASWKTGANPGARGILFLETDGQITHFIVNKTHKFSTGTEVLDSVGGLYVHVFENKPQNLPKKVEQEICYHLGIKELRFKKIIDLGQAHPDYGMTNNTSSLFAAIIDASQNPNIVSEANFDTAHKPLSVGITIVPITEFKNYLSKIEDNYFLSVAARAMTSPEIILPI